MGCNGSCCVAFYLPIRISDLRRDRHPETGKRLEDAAFVADMLVPLTPREANERHRRLGDPAIDDHPFRWSTRGHHFTCRHWDEETRRCGVYDERPHTCRAFPNEGGCEFGCDLEVGTPMEDAIAEAREARAIPHRPPTAAVADA